MPHWLTNRLLRGIKQNKYILSEVEVSLAYDSRGRSGSCNNYMVFKRNLRACVRARGVGLEEGLLKYRYVIWCYIDFYCNGVNLNYHHSWGSDSTRVLSTST